MISVELIVFCDDFDGFSERPEGAPELKPGVERSSTPGIVAEQKKLLPRGDGKQPVEISATP